MSSSPPVNALILLALYLIQNAVHYALPAAPPALILIGVIYVALHEGAVSGAAAGLWAGSLLELLTPGRFGPFIVPYTAAGLLTGLLSGQLFRDSLPTQIVLSGFWALFMTAGAHLAGSGSIQADDPDTLAALGLSVLSPGWLWTAAAAPLVFNALNRLRTPFKRHGRRPFSGGRDGRLYR